MFRTVVLSCCVCILVLASLTGTVRGGDAYATRLAGKAWLHVADNCLRICKTLTACCRGIAGYQSRLARGQS